MEESYYTTDENGETTISNLYQYVDGKYITGEYILKEVKAAEGYITDSREIKFKAEKKEGKMHITILEGEEVLKEQEESEDSIGFTLVNREIFKLRKTGDNSKLLPGAVFQITNLNGEIIGNADGYITDENGEINVNLQEGLYKVVEIKAPEGYELPESEEERTYYIGIGSSKPEETEFKIKSTKTITGYGIQNVYDVKSTEDGGYVVVGSFSGKLDIDGDGNTDSKSEGSLDQLITKYNAGGNIEWFKSSGTNKNDEFNSIDIAADGGYIVGGYVNSSNPKEALLVKFNSNGNKIWERTIGGNYDDQMNDIKVLANGDIVAVGKFASPTIVINNTTITKNGKNNGYIICYDASGNYKWHKAITGTGDIDVTSVTETSQGIVASINYLGNITVDGKSITNAGNQDSAIVAFSTDGTYKWNKKIGGSNDESIAKVITDSEDNIVAVGGFASNLTIGTETINAPTTNYSSSIMIKFSSATGEYVSSKVFGGTNNDDKIMTATATEDGGVLLGGWFYSKDFDIDGDGTNDITSTAGQNDAIIVKLNARNEVEWYKTFDGNSYDENYGITQLSNKSFVAVGGFDSTSLSCGDTANLLRSQGYSDAYIINLDNVVTSAEIPELQEINVENKLKEFKITTEIEENSDGERGGTITGTPLENNINFVEKVKYDYDSITPILITPEAGYSVYSVEINGEKVEFRPDTNGIVTLPVFSKVQEDKHIKVLFEKNLSSVVVHHYIEDRNGNYTTDKAADDEYIIGKIGSKYETAPKIDIERYGLEKDTDGNYVVPSNAKGTFEQTETVVTYYYPETPFSLTVHHYLEGTEDKLEVDEVSSLYKDTEYTTSPSKELLKRYTLVPSATRVTPESAGTSGKIQENTEVSYYYKLKEYQITTEVKEHDETDIGGNISKVKGGNISGAEMTPYETVIINQNSTKDITITADEGYQIKSITIQSIDENGSITEENVKITGKNTTYNLSKFSNLTSNKHVIVEFERIIGTLTVHHYVEKTTNHVPLADGSTADDESKSGYIGNNYATKARTDINENYELVGVPENSSGEYIDGNIEVIYYYKLKDTSVLVHHYLEGTTTKLAEDETKLGKVGDKYTTSSANVDSKYELVTTPNNANGTMTLDQIIVTYYYRVKDTSVLVHHYKEGTTEKVSEDVTKKGKIDDEYTTTIADDLPEYYELVEEPTNKTGTMTEEQIVVTYYYRLKKYQYTVNYLEKGTNKVLHEAKTTQNITYGTVINTKDEVIDINGYGYDSADKDSLSIAVSENIINIYYTKVTGLSYTVNYLEKDTDEVIHPAKTTGKQVFKTEITSADEVIDIDGYNYDSVDKDKLIIGTGENVINIYYTKRNDLSYTVNYLEKDTNKVLHTQKNQTGMTFKAEVKSADETIDIDGYNYDSVDKDSLTITTGENVINIYYTKRTDLSYKVNYLEKTTNKVLHEQKVQENMTFESVVTSTNEVIDIDGYNYDSVDKVTLKITTGENVVNIYYIKRNDLSYTVNYLEKDTNKVLHEQKIQDGMTFESVVTSTNEVIDIDGYNYDSVDKDTLTIGTGENVINIYYTKRNDLSYKVNYLEKGTNKVLHDQKTVENKTFGETIISTDEKIVIDGYNYDSVDKDSLTITTGENVINIYYTKKTDLSYTVNYLEKDTNKVLHNQKIQDGMTFETEVKSADEVIDINGYKYDSADKESVKITTGENVINIYYTKVDGLSYTVNYLEKDTNEVINPAKTKDGMTFKDVVNSSNEVIDIDGYNYDSVDKDTLTIGTGENVINIYYTKRNDLSYKVNYLEKTTNKVLHEQKVQDGMTFENVVTSANEVIEIDGYNYDSVDKATLKITTGENIINIYYTKRNDLSYTVNYLEKTTNKVLHQQKIQDGMTFETEVKSADEVIDINGYKYDSADKESVKITTGENVINIYYTKVDGLSYTVNYLEKDTNEVINPAKTKDGMTFEDVVNSSNEVIDIDGYNYDSVDKDSLTIGTGENVINIYYTKRNDLSYKVNYLEKGTDKVLHDQKIQGKMTFESVVTSANEVIEIDGYNYDSVDKATLTITTGENIINIYYTKRNDLSYTVNYLEKTTNKVLHKQKIQDEMTFESTVTSSDEVIDIDGYNYDSVDKETLTIGTGENVINIYYTKRNDLSYTVNYLEKDTNKVLHEPKTQDGMTFEDVVNSRNYVIAIDGYNYDSVNKDTITIGAGENVINVYYTKRTDLSYTVNYLEKNTNKVLHEPKVQEIMTFESNIISSDEVIDIYGYSYDSVDKETLTITTSENIINIYYTKKDTKVTVHYYEEGTTNKVSEDIEIRGKVFDDYTTTSADNIPSKYELVAEPENKNGIMKEEAISVIYYYRKKVTKVVVHYYEENTTKKLTEDVIIDGRIDDEYTTRSATNISSKYELVAIPSNAKGSMTEETIEVVYYYRVKEAVVNIRYLEKGTNKVLANPDRLVGKDDDDYQTKAKEIEGYKLVEHTGNENGKFGVEPITITYYYLYKTKATVQYIDKITGKILEKSTTEGLEGDDFVTESKDFEKYILVEEPPEKTVKMTKKEQVVKYYYTHVSDGVIEKHIDIISGQVIANDVHNGNEGDTYDIPARTFDGYDLVKDKLPANSKGTMKVEPVEVIYYYIYRTKVTAEYIDKNTGNKLAEEKVQNGYEGDTYTTDRKTFDDYKLVEVPSNADGSMTKENIRVTYYYVHTSGGVIVNHIDIKTGKKLLDETKEKGYEGDSYETHEENISGYDLVKEKYPENATGKMTRGQIRVTYYYIKKTEVNVKYVDKETGEEIDEPTNIPGHEGDDYTTAPKDIPGYDLVEKTENEDGTMTVDPIEVIYYYKRPAKVIVNYYDIDTKEKITDEIEITGHQNDNYTTEQKDIKYYEISKVPENKEGKMIVTVTKNENGKEFVENTIYVNYYYRKLIFNLKVDQTITSVIVNGQETIINGTLGKVEVHRKNISTADIKVIYKIKVTNDSELTGKANVVENIPSGMIMIADDNPEWTINGTTASLETDEIKPGESREYQVVLRWQNGDSNIGTKGNMVSIITENEAGFEEKDKTDNESKADLIVAVETGEVTYVAIAGSILIVMIAIASGIYVIKKKRQ